MSDKQQSSITKPKTSNNLDQDELETLLCKQLIKSLKRERNGLTKEVCDLANFNYAREPEFVRDRLMLRDILGEVADLRHRVMKHLQPILGKLDIAQGKLSAAAISEEVKSEQLAQDYLEKNIATHDEFIISYVKVRKEAIRKRVLADRFAKEKKMLTDNILKPLEPDSPRPTPPQRKRKSLNK